MGAGLNGNEDQLEREVLRLREQAAGLQRELAEARAAAQRLAVRDSVTRILAGARALPELFRVSWGRSAVR